MYITIIGAGNSGLAMAAHLGLEGHNIRIWNRSKLNISKLIETHTIYCEGIINGKVEVELVTDDITKAIENSELILVTTPASSHKELAELIGKNLRHETLIVLNPGRTFGALEFQETYKMYNPHLKQTIAETQTIVYTCRKTGEDSINIISLKNDVLISTFDSNKNKDIIKQLPSCLNDYLKPAKSMIETSIGNVGMILHCAPLLLNIGWTESNGHIYKYYYDGITPSIGKLIEKIDNERVEVSKKLGLEVESTKEWLKRTYKVQGDSLYECIQNNDAYKTIDAPSSLKHRYIFEDIPCGLVPLESIGKGLGLAMNNTSLIIDLASSVLDVDFRKTGRNLESIIQDENVELRLFFNRRED